MIKEVENGGEIDESDFHLTATGFGQTNGEGVEGDGGAEGDVIAGSYRLAEDPEDGDFTTDGYVCVDIANDDAPVDVDGPQNTITLEDGQDVECTITNTFEEEEPDLPHLKLIKEVKNGGDKDDFTLTATGKGEANGVVVSGVGGADSDTDSNITFVAGKYYLAESPENGDFTTDGYV